jgi:hypothetical protein
MAYFLKRLCWFGVPLGLYALFIYGTDPFDFLSAHSIISDQVKMRTALPLNPCLWKMPAFARHPSPNLMLGDSRMEAVKTDRVKEVTGQDYFNLGFGGATLREIISSYWFAATRVHLRHVYIGLNFNLYSDYEQFDRTAEVITIENAPACYFINRTVLQAAVYGTAAQWMGYDPNLGVVTVDRDTFWRKALGPSTEGFYSRHTYPRKYYAKLVEIAQFVKSQGGDVVFVIFPTHVDLQNRVKDFHLESEYDRFKRDLASITTTYDFDYPNEVTVDRDNFSDPYHCRHECMDEVVREIWSGDLKYGRRLP